MYMYMYMPSTKDGSIQIEIRFSRLRSYIAQHARCIILVRNECPRRDDTVSQ